MIVTDKLTTESFHAFIDEQLTDEQYAQVEAQIDLYPEKLEEIQQCHIINERLREVFDPIVEEPVPDDLFELGMYGIISENQDEDLENYEQAYSYEDNTMSFAGMEEETESALDSIDTALELQDENFIDDTEFADIAALSGAQDLSDFDIDALRSDSSNIIPDIFDQPVDNTINQPRPGSMAASVAQQEEQDILESIDSLSVESGDIGFSPKEEDASVHYTLADSETAEDLSDNVALGEPPASDVEEIAPALEQYDTSGLELAPLEETTIESSEFDNELLLQESELYQQSDSGSQPHGNDYQDHTQQAFDTHASGEELLSEPLENEAEDVIELPGDFPSSEHVKKSAATSRTESGSVPSAASARSRKLLNTTQSFAESDEFSSGLPAAKDEHDNFNSVPESPDDFESTEKHADQANQHPNANQDVPEDVVAEFFSRNKNESDFEINDVVKHFEEAAEEFNHFGETQLFDESPVSQFKQKAHELLAIVNDRVAGIRNKFASRSSDSFMDFNKAPAADFFHAAVKNKRTAADDFEDIPSVEEFLAKGKTDAAESPHFEQTVETSHSAHASGEARTHLAPSSTLFDFEQDDESGKTDGITNKIGETLKYYKQRIAEMRMVEGSESVAGIDKFKLIVTDAIHKVSPENRMTIGGVVLLFIGLLVGGSVVTLTQGSAGNEISTEKVEQLAVDSHILYTQQQEQIVAGASTVSVIESLQWQSARIGRQIRLADVQLEGFKHEKSILLPTMANFASVNIFGNEGNQKMTVLVAANIDGDPDQAMVCRIPANVDGLCSWAKDSVRYVVVANLSLSRVRAFSQLLFDKL